MERNMGASDNQAEDRPETNGVSGRPGRNKSNVTRCRECGFRSKRAFNVIRHYERIHGPAKRELKCCGVKFPNKGGFYQHRADVHPESRKYSKVVSTKYKITCAVKKETPKRRSLRLRKSKTENEDLDPQSHFDEKKPSINLLEGPKLVEQKEEIKCEDDDADIKLDCSIEISFNGDVNSPVNEIILREYLKFIDFDTFKI